MCFCILVISPPQSPSAPLPLSHKAGAQVNHLGAEHRHTCSLVTCVYQKVQSTAIFFIPIPLHHQKNQTNIHYYIRFHFLQEFPGILPGMIFYDDDLPVH